MGDVVLAISRTLGPVSSERQGLLASPLFTRPHFTQDPRPLSGAAGHQSRHGWHEDPALALPKWGARPPYDGKVASSFLKAWMFLGPRGPVRAESSSLQPLRQQISEQLPPVTSELPPTLSACDQVIYSFSLSNRSPGTGVGDRS